MGLWKIAWRSIQQRAFASTLTAISMALGVMLVVAVINGYTLLKRTFDTNRSLPYNLIVSAKGGNLQIVMNTVFLIDKPNDNLPYSYYLDFLPAHKRTDGKPSLYGKLVETAVPVCMGDYYRNFRAVGTTSAFFTELGPSWNEKFSFQAGGPFKQEDYFDAVIGATVAHESGLKLGGKLKISHGAEEGSEHKDEFTVVGILAPTGTPVDRGAYVNMEGFYLLDNHSRTDKPADDGNVPAVAQNASRKPLPISQREISAILLKTSSEFGLPEFGAERIIKAMQQDPQGRGVAPIQEITRLFSVFVDPLLLLLLALTATVVIVSGLSVLVSIYNSMSERQHEIAVMRALGANRGTVMLIVLLESILLSLGGGFLGWVAGHVLLAAASPAITATTGIPTTLLQFSPLYELILVAGLMVLASVVGFLPALTAYRTDVAKALTAAP